MVKLSQIPSAERESAKKASGFKFREMALIEGMADKLQFVVRPEVAQSRGDVFAHCSDGLSGCLGGGLLEMADQAFDSPFPVSTHTTIIIGIRNLPEAKVPPDNAN